MMRSFSSAKLFTPVFIAISALSTWASAQNIYKCGDSYSSQNCQGGTQVDASDKRTPGQKAQADKSTVRDAHLGQTMEAKRLAQERKDLAANTPKSVPGSAKVAKDMPVTKTAKAGTNGKKSGNKGKKITTKNKPAATKAAKPKRVAP